MYLNFLISLNIILFFFLSDYDYDYYGGAGYGDYPAGGGGGYGDAPYYDDFYAPPYEDYGYDYGYSTPPRPYPPSRGPPPPPPPERVVSKLFFFFYSKCFSSCGMQRKKSIFCSIYSTSKTSLSCSRGYWKSEKCCEVVL